MKISNLLNATGNDIDRVIEYRSNVIWVRIQCNVFSETNFILLLDTTKSYEMEHSMMIFVEGYNYIQ